MRPILWHIDHDADPPTLTVCVVDRPCRIATIQLDDRGITRRDTEIAAIAEMRRTNPAVYDVMATVRVTP